MYLTQGLHRSARIKGDHPATIFGDRCRGWREVRERVSRLAAGFVSLGLKKGDRVAVIALNSDLYIEAYYAIAWAGGVVVPGNIRWAAAEHIHALQDSDTRFLLVDKNFLPLAAALTSACAIEATILLDGGGEPAPAGMASSEALIADSLPMEDACGANDDLAGIFYTGGTTGRAKGVMLSHRGLVSNFLCANAVAPYPVEPVFLHSPPMFHLADASAVFGITMLGGTHVVIPFFTPEGVARAIESEKVSALVLVPTMFGMLADYLSEHPADLGSVVRVLYGASPISETLLKLAMRMFPSAEFAQAYGQTELSPCATILESRFHRMGDGGKSLLRSAGRAIPGVDVRIVNEAMAEQPMGEVGEIAVRSPGAMLGYWKQPELTRQTIVDGWLRTGDAGYMDENGFVYLVDRVKDMIISGGENVFSAEVENALAGHPAIAECAVIGVPDQRWGERVHAIVRLREGTSVTEDDVIAHCKTLIAGYKCPRSVEFRQEPLPLSAAGKILKSELRKSYWQDGARHIN